jgi:hypothetical protein
MDSPIIKTPKADLKYIFLMLGMKDGKHTKEDSKRDLKILTDIEIN